MISKLWVAFLVLSFVFGAITGRIDAVAAAAAKGAAESVTLVIGIAGIMSLWSGMMELVRASGLAGKIARILRPLLRPLFGEAARDRQAMETVSANVTANLLGLSNAATPIGLQAADRLHAICGRSGAPDPVLTLIALNTASIQLVPATVAAVRAGYGASNPYDIMPAVWGASISSVVVVLLAARILRRFWGDGKAAGK